MTAARPASTMDRSGTPQRIGALHRQGENWRLVVLETTPALRVIEHAAFRGDPKPRIADVAQRHRLTRLVRVAPARGTVVRAASVPEGAPAETASALMLLAEAQLPGSLPGHRRSAGLIPNAGNNGTRAVLLTGFDAPVDPPGPLVRRLDESWTTEPVALALLRGGRGSWAGAADPSSGAISVIATGPERSAARILFEDAALPGRFAHAAARVLAETCTSVGLDPPPLLDLPGIALCDDAAEELRRTVQGVPDNRQWLDEYGVALGAAMAAAQPDELARSLTGLRESARVVRPPITERAVRWLSRPPNAAGALGAALLLMLAAPLAAAGLRLSILNTKGAGLAVLSRARDEEALRAATYTQLARSRWPMSKLLADLVRAMPVGVLADSIVIGPDQGVTIQATAPSPDQLAELQQNLNAGRIFGNVRVNRDETTSSGVRFDLTCTVVNADGIVPAAEDFAAKPLAVRLYGEGASNTAAPIQGVSADDHPRAPTRTTSRDRTESDGERPERSSRSAESRRPDADSRPTGEAPPPLTDEQIKALDRSAALKEMIARRTFPQHNPATDAATKSRLADEVRKIQDHVRTLNAAPAPGGGP